MAPRPILKPLPLPLPEFTRRSSQTSIANALPFAGCRPNMLTPHVHFPPTPIIASTQTTHSSTLYDRAPIVVGPNSCELPERGERMYMSNSPSYVLGRCGGGGSSSTCVSTPGPGATVAPKGGYFHPLAFQACEWEPVPTTGLDVDVDVDVPNVRDTPSLIPDISSPSSPSSSSDSDDSDGYGYGSSASGLSSPMSPSMLGPHIVPFAQRHGSQEDTHSHSHSHSHSLQVNHAGTAFSFLTYPPPPPASSKPRLHRLHSPARSKPSKLLRRKSFYPLRDHDHSTRTGGEDCSGGQNHDHGHVAFKEPQLEGCLGGF